MDEKEGRRMGRREEGVSCEGTIRAGRREKDVGCV